MIVHKITTGYVIQKFDTETNKFLDQEFIAGDEVSYENAFGESADEFDNYLPFDMVQPKVKKRK